MQRNLADLQKTLTGEFSKKLQEWEKLKNQQVFLSGLASPSHLTATNSNSNHNPEGGNLPHEFKKKLHEWEKMKEKEKVFVMG